MTRIFQCLIASLFVLSLLGSCKKDDGGAPARVRKNVKNLTAQEKADFVNAIKLLKTKPSPYESGINYYDQFVKWHYLAFFCGVNSPMIPGHQNPAFLPWHRCYLSLFEKALSDVSGKTINLPYWDWTDASSTAAVFSDDLMGGSGDPSQDYKVTSGPFRAGEWVINITDDNDIDSIFLDVNTEPHLSPHLHRAMGIYAGGTTPVLPSLAEVNNTLSINTYDSAPWDPSVDTAISFRNSLEGWRGCAGNTCENDVMDVVPIPGQRRSTLHNIVHVYVGGIFQVNGVTVAGNMAQSTSPNDPVFWIHHANIDRLWSAWMRRHGAVYAPVIGGPMHSNLNDVMPPFQFRTDGKNTPASMLNEYMLGYVYEQLP